MKIEALKINGVPAPLGFALPFVEVSFKVRDTESKKARNGYSFLQGRFQKI